MNPYRFCPGCGKSIADVVIITSTFQQTWNQFETREGIAIVGNIDYDYQPETTTSWTAKCLHCDMTFTDLKATHITQEDPGDVAWQVVIHG